MLGVTFFGIFLTPVFFYVIAWFGDRKPAKPESRDIGERIPVEMREADGQAAAHTEAKPVGR
jgi:hypothetical protein